MDCQIGCQIQMSEKVSGLSLIGPNVVRLAVIILGCYEMWIPDSWLFQKPFHRAAATIGQTLILTNAKPYAFQSFPEVIEC
jgi:hypothetical protein